MWAIYGCSTVPVLCDFTPLVYTCGVSVLQDLRRTTAVLGGL